MESKEEARERRPYENLLVVIKRRDSTRDLEQAITECAFAMIDVCDDAEIPKSFAWNCGDALLELAGVLLGDSHGCSRLLLETRSFIGERSPSKGRSGPNE